MKKLSLYIDKWFITVAVNEDGNVKPLSLPNGEDRIWLFFHEDTANNRVVYGKSFEINYRDKEPHYFGDIFPLIESNEHHFTRYDNRPEEMREIFKVSNIFSHLREAIGRSGGPIETYISFSSDISDIARLKFIQELEEANFKVKESVARISHLSLEESKKRGIFSEEGFYLALVATNDNLHFSLYKFTESIFVRKNEDCLSGMGLDVRKRALIESVVENINRTAHFISTIDDLHKEYKRQERFADNWLQSIANARPGVPVSLPNVTFAVAPNNPYSVLIKPKDLDERTQGLVDDIVRKIAEFVRSNNIQPHEIKGISFIGNTFTNTKFTDSINTRFIVDQDKIVIYREIELPKVVSIYSQIDCSQFSEATEKFVKDAETQEELKRQAQEEERRKNEALEEARRQQIEKDLQQKAEREYQNAIENIEKSESEHNYEKMRDWAEIALTHRPEDEYAKEKLSSSQQLLAEQRAANKQFNTILQRAKTAFNERRWTDAISQIELALELRPNSEEAHKIKKESKRQLDVKEKVTNFLNRADMFYAQKLYNQALEEVGKVLNLDPTNEEAKIIKDKVSEIYSQHEEKIKSLVSRMESAESENNFSEAIHACECLISEDSTNVGKWTAKKERIIAKKKEVEDIEKKIGELRKEINTTLFEEDWIKLKLLCENYLSLKQDKEVSQFLSKAKKRIEEITVREAKEKALALINQLILDKRFNEAEEAINRFAHNYPSEQSVVKDLRSKLFSFDNEAKNESQNNTRRNPVGFSSPKPVEEKVSDDFFDSPEKKSKIMEPQRKRASNPKEDDFFSNSKRNSSINPDGKSKISNNDFNF